LAPQNAPAADRAVCPLFPRLKVAALFRYAVLLFTLAAARGETIDLKDGVFRVSGIRTELGNWSAIFSVYAGDATTPMLGEYAFKSGVLEFRPRFPLASGVRYRAEFHAPGAEPIRQFFDGPKAAVESLTRVDRVYPSAQMLPENVLKLYIFFSAPMARGEAWRHIHLLDRAGQPIKGAFLEIDQELWDPQMRRLTVLFDPGRIKRDLAPNLQMGLPILAGRSYTLAIDKEFLDARGVALAADFRKPFRGAPAERAPLDSTQWRIAAPHAGSRDPLTVQFPKPLDYALLQRTISIHLGGATIHGTIAITHEETEWSFTPANPWKAGAYELAIDTILEDIAGNRLGRAFDRDEGDRAKSPTGEVRVPFEIR
jgi:hypothetical protein